MRLFTLTPRLAVCAGLVRCGCRLADIGTDHAKLPVWLARQGKISGALACDISPGAIASAEKTIALHGSEKLVEARISDGLAAVMPNEVDDIVIAGMGGDQISMILSDNIICQNGWLQNPRYNLILQPMSHPERLREALNSGGFEIVSETAVREGRRIYIIIQVRYNSTPNQINPYIGRLAENRDEASRDYLKRQAVLYRLEARGHSMRGDDALAQKTESIADEMEQAAEGMEAE